MPNEDTMTEAERDAAFEEIWMNEHPLCDGCNVRGCAHDCCKNRDGIVMLTDGTFWHPGCLAREQAIDARMGGTR